MWGRLWTEQEFRHVGALTSLIQMAKRPQETAKYHYGNDVRKIGPTTGSRFIRPIAAIIVQVARPGERDAASTST